MSDDIVERLRVERDEARREVCEWVALERDRTKHVKGNKRTQPSDIADERGWDCFKKEDE